MGVYIREYIRRCNVLSNQKKNLIQDRRVKEKKSMSFAVLVMDKKEKKRDCKGYYVGYAIKR
jgi:hypothetical protein